MKQLLIVDDDEVVLSGLAAALESEHFTVHTVSNGRDALETLGKNPVDLVLTDLVMEEMDGLTLMRRIAERWPEVPVMVLTGHGTASSAMEAMRQGAADFIQKPARPEEVLHRIMGIFAAQDMRRRMQAERSSAEARQAVVDARAARRERMESSQMLMGGLAEDMKNIVHTMECDQPIIAHAIPPGSPAEAAVVRCKTAFETLKILHASLLPDTPDPHEPQQICLADQVRAFLESPHLQRLRDDHPLVAVEARLNEGLPSVRMPLSRMRALLQIAVGSAFNAVGKSGRILISTNIGEITSSLGHYHEGVPGRYQLLRVQHTAVVPKEDLEHIFEPYYAQKKMGRTAAAGFGFTRIYQWVHHAGGFIEMHSEQRLGTELTIYFPSPENVESIAPTAFEPGASLDLGAALVVDDHAGAREHAEKILNEFGYRVETAASVSAAVELCAARHERGERPYNLAVIDLVLGEPSDGLDLYQRLCEIEPNLKAVLTGGFADTERISQARKLGVLGYLKKPFTRDALAKTLRAAGFNF